jgi:hypothetical protein
MSTDQALMFLPTVLSDMRQLCVCVCVCIEGDLKTVKR